MFYKLKQNSKEGKSFWIKMMETKASIVFSILDNDILDVRVFNEKTIYRKDFKLGVGENIFKGDLSFDGNEYELYINNLRFNLYYNLDNALVLSCYDKDRRMELVTLPEVLLN